MKIFKVGRAYRKADLSLSMNAIVVLILAITLLGLGLTFLRGLFKQIEAKTTESMGTNEVPISLNKDRPIGINPSKVADATVGKSTSVKLYFLNAEPVDVPYRLELYTESDEYGSPSCSSSPCNDLSAGRAVMDISFPSAAAMVKKDTTSAWTITITPRQLEERQLTTVLLRATLICDTSNIAADVDQDKCDSLSYSSDLILDINP